MVLNDDWWEAYCCPCIWLMLCLKKHSFLQNNMLIRTKCSISLQDAGNPVRKMQYCLDTKMKSDFNQKCCFRFMLCYKDMQHWSKDHPIVERGGTGQNWIPFSLIFIDSIQYFIAKTAAPRSIHWSWLICTTHQTNMETIPSRRCLRKKVGPSRASEHIYIYICIYIYMIHTCI